MYVSLASESSCYLVTASVAFTASTRLMMRCEFSESELSASVMLLSVVVLR